MLANQASYPAVPTPVIWRLWLIQSLLLLLLTPAFNFWSLAIFALLLLAKLPQLLLNRPAWSLKLSNLLALTIVSALLLFARDLGVLHLMIHLLLLAAILRLLGFREHDHADVQQLLWVQYFLFACCFILHQALGMALLVFMLLLLQLQSHYLAFAAPGSTFPYKSALKTSLIFVPLWLSLFLLFPRIAPLWALPGAKQAMTGLGDELNPGSIERLVESDELAFRVEFQSRLPQPDELYWRARIYDTFDGSSWRRRYNNDLADFSKIKHNSNLSFSYKIIVEPHQQRHLYSLGVPLKVNYPQRIDTDALLSSRSVLSQRASFQLQSVLAPVPDFPGAKNNTNLQLPPGNPKSRALAAQLAAEHKTPEQLVLAIGRYLREGGFRYSLNPPALSGDQIDMFLWQSKSGFCSHYAQTTTFLLRAAGVPARIVGGYLGGEWRDNQSYLEVTQRAAHAWVEYLHQGAWHKFDPTLQVAPQRLFAGLEDLLSAADLLRLEGNWLGRAGFAKQLLQQLEDLDYYWSRWVLGFDNEQQQSLLSSVKNRLLELAALDWWYYIKIVLLLLTAALLSRLLWLRLTTAPPGISVWLVRELSPWLVKTPEQTVLQYLAALGHHSTLQQQSAVVSAHYQQLVFAGDSKAEKQLRAEVQQLKKLLKQQRR
ncbi:MAG TPA: DUF3488 domain-containing protein [Rheinheimera sp.]|uniref:transglutaminase family protein n=1 Tax=Rheinheimera sp. TaxID=1869214 RepID=UPI000EE232C3|nr:DUF3488 and transglutaminase-like domain-containing protein [Rheinheimera sp.]HCU66277.1 DUF3488 domain-containing protein [Rheinheimera sp.]